MGEVETVGERKFAGKFTEKSLLFIFAPTPGSGREWERDWDGRVKKQLKRSHCWSVWERESRQCQAPLQTPQNHSPPFESGKFKFLNMKYLWRNSLFPSNFKHLSVAYTLLRLKSCASPPARFSPHKLHRTTAISWRPPKNKNGCRVLFKLWNHYLTWKKQKFCSVVFKRHHHHHHHRAHLFILQSGCDAERRTNSEKKCVNKSRAKIVK